ncbi:Adenylate/guanylate cyclase catalytic domain-containing protein [Desulfonema limicola]|uniref:Adenylate/guanylate cyclase catalytic domain-containing protein n=1 Tax=Desulfonema limicola TaxID=45656 RepID=A0A975BCQ3_9BACT|nr:TIR domain-containing protein [Desulfonema limicola]QTA82966.1 Adenylate/guanylate cyclase catalytic domain-containing protein [Desulfonema limicola]
MKQKPTIKNILEKEVIDFIIEYYGNDYQRTCFFRKGQRIIKQGEYGDDCFIIKNGELKILVKDYNSGIEKDVGVRSERTIVGEIAFLYKNTPRTASVEVVSDEATLIRLNKDDLFEIVRGKEGIKDTILLYFEQLAKKRIIETKQVTTGKVNIESKFLTVLVSDIHNFSILSNHLWEEQINSFLFDFLEHTEEISDKHDGIFEDQGDGFKIIFQNKHHIENALDCSIDINKFFREIRSDWIMENSNFTNIGLGTGICTDFMSIRKRVGTKRSFGRILSPTINIAAAMSKYKNKSDDTDILVDSTTFSFIDGRKYDISPPLQVVLEKLAKIYTLYKLEPKKIEKSNIKIFISYANEDRSFSKRIYDDLSTFGFSPWLDCEKILPGQDWKKTIKKAIKESTFFLALLSSNSVSKNGYVQKELKIAFELLENQPNNSIFIIPARLDECHINEELIHNIHWVDLYESYEIGFNKIIEAIKSMNS